MSMEHGTISYYTNKKCRCDACRIAWNEYRRTYWHDVKQGPRTVPAQETIGYIGLLLDNGFTYTSISTASGVARSTIGRIHRGDFKRVRRVTEAGILGVMLTETVPGHKVPVQQILPAIDKAREHGASMRAICRAAGLHHRYVPRSGRIGWDKFARIVLVLRIAVRDRVLPASVLDEVGA